ncbi:MAG: flavin reductase family protein [Corynebacterium humireducens]|uniref:Flavin reductase family protein n=1 Tax=Corynebacterium humireducens TaxID=1223514 RepID=A0A7X6SUB8_9CORY|nr:flavin reductase family protein [Corynebacterium humireducens]
MPNNAHFYEPAAGHGLPHSPFNAIIAPRPIGWISSRSADGVLNLAPYSFFNAFSYTPPLIGFASIGEKDSVANIRETGEFCGNLATRDLAEAMTESARIVDKQFLVDVHAHDLAEHHARLGGGAGGALEANDLRGAALEVDARHSEVGDVDDP